MAESEEVNVRVVYTGSYSLPAYKTESSAGMDLHAEIKDAIIMKPLQRKLIPTGLFIELPEGYEAQVRPRSGLTLKKGITVLNAPGTIDADYRGEVGVILINLSSEDYELTPGERIAQMVVAEYSQVSWQQVAELGDTDRGEGGFGSTGIKN